jgi:hypothetical protein
MVKIYRFESSKYSYSVVSEKSTVDFSYTKINTEANFINRKAACR